MPIAGALRGSHGRLLLKLRLLPSPGEIGAGAPVGLIEKTLVFWRSPSDESFVSPTT